MAEKTSIAVRINEAVVQMSSNNQPLMDFLHAVLGKINAEGQSPNVRADLDWVRDLPLTRKRPPLGRELPQAAINVHALGDTVGIPYVPNFPGFSVRYQDGDSLEVSGQLNYQTVWDGLRSVLGRYTPNYFPTRLMYHMLYFPAAWYLGRYLSIFWVHAGAVVRDGKALVIGGLPGCGKSTLCLRMVGNGDFSLLSDDLLFYDRGQMHTCYEPVRVDDPAQADSEVVARMGEKSAFEVAGQVLGSGRPEMLVLPRFAETTALQPLSSQAAADRLYTTSRLAAQVAEFDYYATILSSYFELDDWYPRQQQQLRQLLAEVACFSLHLSRDEGPDKAYQAVMEAADGIF